MTELEELKLEVAGLEERVTKIEKTISGLGTKDLTKAEKASGSIKTGNSLPGRISDLVLTGFFKDPRSPKEVQGQLQLNGFHHDYFQISNTLLRQVKKKKLRRIAAGDGIAGNKIFKYVFP